jgi:hypothetical protein
MPMAHEAGSDGGPLVALSEHAVIDVRDAVLLEVVAVGGVYDGEVNVNSVCGGAEINNACHGSNGTCTASPNAVCGSNTVCSEFHV